MKRQLFTILAVLMLGGLLLTACGGGGGAATEASQVTVPAAYAGKTNPVTDAAAGKDIYTVNCASCHGDSGKGDGAAGSALTPKPAVLAGTTKADDYLFWRINEGGSMAPFSSSMPAFKGVLTEEQIWQTIAYTHSLK